jgi:hypothetical protein
MSADGKIARLRAHPAPIERAPAAMQSRISGSRVRSSTRTLLRWLFGALLATGLPASSGAETAPGERTASVILISLDGTRPADIGAETTPRLFALGERGAVAPKMIGVVPTNTFPSHVSLVTGVGPERHGLVNNHFVDPVRGDFEKKDIPTWIDVEPIWSLLERAGIPTASYHWVGSEGAWPGGRAPSAWKRFDSRTSEKSKVDQILAWMDRPDGEQPRLITSWFHGADHAAHDDGPGSESAIRSLRLQDFQIGRLYDELSQRGRLSDTTLIFVSDHGMARTQKRVDLGRELKTQDGLSVRVLGIGGFATVVLRERDRGDDAIVRRIVARARGLGLEAEPRATAPAEWRVANPRFGDVVVRAPIGTAIVTRGLSLEGFHGYDPTAPEMASLFIAVGRSVTPGTRLPVVANLDVAPTVLALLGRPIPEWIEGAPIEAITGNAVAPAAASKVGADESSAEASRGEGRR